MLINDFGRNTAEDVRQHDGRQNVENDGAEVEADDEYEPEGLRPRNGGEFDNGELMFQIPQVRLSLLLMS
jgi:hypothetical protein